MRKLALSALLLLLPALALAAPTGVANGLRYNNVELAYTFGEFDDFDDLDFDGARLSGSWLLQENLFITGTYASAESDSALWEAGGFVFPGKLEVSELNVGLGIRHPLAPSVDLTGTVGLAWQELELAGASEDDTSLLLRIGLRAMLTPQLELSGGAAYTDLLDESGFTFDANAAFYFAEQWALVGGVTLYEAMDGTFWNIGARYSF